MKTSVRISVIASLLVFLTLFSRCSFFNDLFAITDQTPTQTLIQGLWVVTSVVDTTGKNITSDVSFPVAAFDFNNVNGFSSTGDAMATCLVYGNGTYFNVESKVQQTFDYTKLMFNTGDFGMGLGVVDTFTLGFRLSGIGGSGTLASLLQSLGINSNAIQLAGQTVYHKFMCVGISFSPSNDTMTWDFNRYTHTLYTVKDPNLNDTPWLGVGNLPFKKMTVTLVRKTGYGTFSDLVKSYQPKN
jgi:hypothetical protein